MTSDIAIIGRNLLKLRRSYGYSQREVGEILGTSFQQIQKYERGHNRIPVDKLHKLKEFYAVSYEAFFYGMEGDRKIFSDEDRISNIENSLRQCKDLAFRNRILKAVELLLDLR